MKKTPVIQLQQIHRKYIVGNHYSIKVKLIIAFDGSKKHNSFGGACVIANKIAIQCLEGINPDFDTIKEMQWFRSEAFEDLLVFIFLKRSCNYFMIKDLSEIDFFCDNL